MYKALPANLIALMANRTGRRNVGVLVRFLLALAALVVIYAALFQVFMRHEGQEHSFIDGIYWTLVTMSTLGFGDITFRETPGRMFSIVVIISGTLFMLTLLPFAFIQFFYSPWMEARKAAIAPRSLPAGTEGHIIMTRFGPLTTSLVTRLVRRGRPHVVIVSDVEEAIRLHDQGISVMVGEVDDPQTYIAARIEKAALVVTTLDDPDNAAVTIAVRAVSESVRVIAVASRAHADKVYSAAGVSQVLSLGHVTGTSLAHRIVGGDAMTHVIGSLDELRIAEANALRTPLVGKTLRENRLNELGVTVVGVWDRGQFQPAGPETVITSSTILVLAGTAAQLERYDEEFSIYNVSDGHVLIIGAGRVGTATARALERRGVEHRLIERSSRASAKASLVTGDASDPDVLRSAGLDAAHAVVITTHDDATNVYLTILIRHLRPDIQIISRSSLERSVETLHRAGADFVISTASIFSSYVLNLLDRSSMLMLAEGLTVFRFRVDADMAGRSLADLALRRRAGCSVVAVYVDGVMRANPSPTEPLIEGSELLMIGGSGAEERLESLARDEE